MSMRQLGAVAGITSQCCGQYSGTVCPVGTILASLSVQTTAGLFRVEGRDLGVLDASRESLALLFLLVVLVSEAEETAEVTCIRR